MAQLDLYRLPRRPGFILEVQANLLIGLSTAAVVPLLPQQADLRILERLNPVFNIDGIVHVMLTQSIATVPRKELGPPVSSLNSQHYFNVINALDMLISGS
ncbi:CcdB family protein [Nitrospirillum sp. BR 11828]|uniref:CcdB family protein n=1 Tax=Nitrospirillum sp. BR 11828 TaxID=3104325 RepID=UPI002ACAF418|nr:CcdB family protein [Nitrospirillum sp. BR 11828]MDZ5649569.1 CcdB family protein [Nitrospirillum sp. BR 11828]